jgi:C1A family cysteine protease
MIFENTEIESAMTGGKVRTGWLPPYVDLRDYTENHPEIAGLVGKLKIRPGRRRVLPAKADLREWCPEIEDQGDLGSCSANAAVGVAEYFERRAHGKWIDGSRLFVYKTARNLMGVTGDTGAWIRNVMGAIALCGIPHERYWPYQVGRFDKEPSSFVYSVAKNYEGLKYYCHDPLSVPAARSAVLDSVKRHLHAGIPSMFGFFGRRSFEKSDVKGGIPWHCPGEKIEWGHAVAAVGYDDGLPIQNTQCRRIRTRGALLIRNSWGKNWGDGGYGWLPYEYVLNNEALDFWSLLSMEWADTGMFGI